jgi:hypothetical protein
VVSRLRAQSLALVERARRRRATRVAVLSVAILASLIGYVRLDAYRVREQRFAKARTEFDAREATRFAPNPQESERVEQLLARVRLEAQLRFDEEHPRSVKPVRNHQTLGRHYTGDDEPLDDL